jgi:hypothetical protein
MNFTSLMKIIVKTQKFIVYWIVDEIFCILERLIFQPTNNISLLKYLSLANYLPIYTYIHLYIQYVSAYIHTLHQVYVGNENWTSVFMNQYVFANQPSHNFVT